MIKKYIEFAIENGYEIKYQADFSKLEGYVGEVQINKDIIDNVINKDINGTLNFHAYMVDLKNIHRGSFSVIETITSKPFIEAIARGIEYKFPNYTNGKHDTYGWSEEDRITFYQVIAIRENKLDEYITKLLKG